MTPISPPSPWGVENFDLSQDGRLLAYSVNEDGLSKIALVDIVTRRALPQPKLPNGSIGDLNFSRDGRKLAIDFESATEPGDVWSWDVAGGTLERWTESEVGPLDRAMLLKIPPNRANHRSCPSG